MLGVIEQLVVEALQPRLPAGRPVIAGAALLPLTESRVVVQAQGLSSNTQEATADRRRPAYHSRRYRLIPDVNTADPTDRRNFTLPLDALPEVEDVCAPDGMTLRRGTAYTLEGRTIRFYRNDPPAPLEVLVRGGPAAGYLDRTSCRVQLDVTAWAAAVADADAMLAVAVPTALAVFVQRDTLTLAWDDAAGFRMRFQGMTASLGGITRNTEPVGTTIWARSRARFVLHGELEMMLVAGLPEPVEVIQDVRYRVE